MRRKFALAAAAALLLLGSAPRRHVAFTGSFKIDVPGGPFISASRLSMNAAGVEGPVSYSVLGAGRIDRNQYVAPEVSRKTTVTLIGSARGAVALQRIEIVPAPRANRPLIAVATYRNGIALHDPRTFALIGYVPIGGAPGDVAFGKTGDIFAPDTDGDSLISILRAPWDVRTTRGVTLGNEVAVENTSGSVFVSNRDAGGFGALTRISAAGRVTRVKTGAISEGLAIDPARKLAYVGDVNMRSVAQVDTRTMRVVRTIPSVERTFGIALDAKADRLFAVSNTSPSMPSHGGYVAAIDLRGHAPHIVLRSARMVFPLGVALDRRHSRLFVTDEAASAVYVLSSKTLKAVHAPLRTCATPWRPSVFSGRLYVPCSNADKVDVFDVRSLRRVRGAPFATGGYPLSVAVWKPPTR
ncbi:MAG TPA: hypothetical protein VFN37_04470 [Candidatus Baltobacteraceae bacterium]|nr:hypothetical protein [Candidatus Baltobacteraceae bacterium]